MPMLIGQIGISEIINEAGKNISLFDFEINDVRQLIKP
jgi:hypothetical protein